MLVPPTNNVAMTALSDSDKAELRKRLHAARSEVLDQIRPRRGDTDEPGSASHLSHLGQPDDMSQAIEIADNEMALLSQEQDLLSEINAAIERVDKGIANMCISCGEDIAFERLLAVPTAQTCIRCQQTRENSEQRSEHRPQAPTL